MRTILSTELPPFEKAVGLFITGGGSAIIIAAPFIYATHLDSGFYFVGFPLMLLFSVYLVSRIFQYRNIYFDTQHVYVASKGKELAIPLSQVTGVTRIMSQCWIRYTENGKSRSVHFIVRKAPFLFGGIFSDSVAEFRRMVSQAHSRHAATD